MNRIGFLDYTKAWSIIFVIAIHVGFSRLNYAVLFVMPAFYIITGYGFNPDKRSVGKSISSRFKALMIPFWVFMIFYTLIELIRAPLFGYGGAEVAISSLANTAYGSGIIPLWGGAADYLKEIMSYKTQGLVGVDAILPTNCHLWFLPATFTGYVAFVLLEKPTGKSLVAKILSILALLAFASVEVIFPSICQLPYGIGRGAVAAAYMLVGLWLKQSGAIEKKSVPFHIVACLVAAAVAVGATLFGSDASAMVRSYYGPYGALSLLLTFLGGVAATWLLFELFRGVDALPVTPVKKFLSFTGRNVFTVYILHMAVKFLFDCIYVLWIAKGETDILDGYKMGLMPEKSVLYMLFEIVAVVAVCLLIAMMKNRIMKRKA